jgi:hypothetical protein
MISKSSFIKVHHSRKNTKGESAYRGTSKMAVVFNTIIKLEWADGIHPRGYAGFDLSFEKFCGLADDTTEPMRATLKPGEPWRFETSPASMMEHLVALVRTVEYGTQQALVEKLSVDQATVSRLRRKAIAAKLISEEEWARCLRMAKEPFEGVDDNDAARLTDF